MKGTRTLLSLAVGIALASPSVYAAGFSCPADSDLTPIPVIQGSGDKSPLLCLPGRPAGCILYYGR